MSSKNTSQHQTNLVGTDLPAELYSNDSLRQLVSAIPWQDFETSFSVHYSNGISALQKPIR